MRFLLCLALLISCPAFAQKDVLENASKAFHRMLVLKDEKLSKVLDRDLSYGHSNGWIETKEELIQNLATGKMKYVEIGEDSIISLAGKDLGYVRYVSQVSVQMDGKQVNLRLKVLEVWRKKNGSWKLFARQAIKA